MLASNKRNRLPEEDFSDSLKRFREVGETIKSTIAKCSANNIYIPTRAQDAEAKPTGIDAHHAIMDAIMNNIKIQNDYLPFTEDQLIVQHVTMGACATMVYKGFIKSHEREIRLRWNFPTLMRGLIFTAPRRAGKTAIVTAIIVALFLAVKGIVIIVVANGARSAGQDMGILAGVKKILTTVFGVTQLKKDVGEHITKEYAPDDIRRVSSFSGNVGNGLGRWISVGVSRYVYPRMSGSATNHTATNAPGARRNNLRWRFLHKVAHALVVRRGANSSRRRGFARGLERHRRQARSLGVRMSM